MADKPITYIAVSLGPKVGENDALIGIRVVPVCRDGNTIIAKTLNHGEPDSGEGIVVEPGVKKLVLPPGNLKITIQDIDRESQSDSYGYSTVSNTIWTWLQVGPFRDEELFRFLFAAARRLDTAHGLCTIVLDELAKGSDEPFIKFRARLFRALGYAEQMCVAFNRAVVLMEKIASQFSTSTNVPVAIDAIQPKLKEIRDAFEHIEERAMGEVFHKPNPDALSIFVQKDFFPSGILSYSSHSLDLKAELVPALIAGRQFIIDVAVEKSGRALTYNDPMEFSVGLEA